jgi:uncharacterized protein with FMN-binding domain
MNKRKFTDRLNCFTLIAFCMSALFSCSMVSEILDVREMPINDVDLTVIHNGTYEGSFAYLDFVYVVHTTIVDHQIVEIKIVKNRDTKRAKMATVVVPRVVENQTPNVDTVSGASVTARALLKAIENSVTDGELVN